MQYDTRAYAVAAVAYILGEYRGLRTEGPPLHPCSRLDSIPAMGTASRRGRTATDNRPLVTLQLAEHSAIPLKCCAVPKPSPTQVTQWGETLTVYCANCSVVLVEVIGPPVNGNSADTR